MLLEALNFAASYATSPRRNAGEINSSVNLWARARRCARDWAEHEENSKAFVQRAIEMLPQRRVAVVLGSGLLRDVPIALLSKSFSEVRLYDLQHLASVRAWAAIKGLRNLTFECLDLSGFEALRDTPSSPPTPLAFLAEIADLDFIVSANLLSQIGVGVGHLMETQPNLPADTVGRLIQAHVDGLNATAAPSCLLTDISYDVIGKSGEVLERDDLMHGATLPSPHTEWQWLVAPYGELDPTYKAVHRVVAIRLPAEVRKIPLHPSSNSAMN
ncbi:hypothetical protein JJB09_00910 [Rhizobium sp. KVB221]|uniref:Methyltransferase n=1 Tax=Rhizobium setariae TaxID=2801340 RepID=A0A936YQM4_9HYPH|nr:hypothetical protein [Rhizobium setariae]MBL0370575.1 hypothetical protein [Rhizobium setariae]